MKIYAFSLFCFLLLPFFLLGQNGLDQTFGTNGKKVFFLQTPTTNFVHRIQESHPDSLKRIIVFINVFEDASSKILVNRILENGNTDTTFGQSRFFAIPLNDSNNFYFNTSAIDAQGRILFAGITQGVFPDTWSTGICQTDN